MSALFTNLKNQLPEVLGWVSFIAYVIGIFMILIAIVKSVRKSAGYNDVTVGSIVGTIAVGGLLMANELWMLAVLETFTSVDASFYSKSHPVLTYMEGTSSASTPFQQMMRVLLGVVQFFGYISVLRGLLLFKRASDGNSVSHGGADAAVSGFWHTFFGALAINIKYFLTGAVTLFGFGTPAFLA